MGFESCEIIVPAWGWDRGAPGEPPTNSIELVLSGCVYTSLVNPAASGLKESPGTLIGTVGGGFASKPGCDAFDANRCCNACVATVTFSRLVPA